MPAFLRLDMQYTSADKHYLQKQGFLVRCKVTVSSSVNKVLHHSSREGGKGSGDTMGKESHYLYQAEYAWMNISYRKSYATGYSGESPCISCKERRVLWLGNRRGISAVCYVKI